MRQKTTLLQVVLSVCLFAFSACKSVKESQIQATNQKPSSETISTCDQTIKYFSDKIIAEGQEVGAKTEIVINSSAKQISLTSEPPSQERVNFDTVIESIDCNLNSDLTEGKAIYKGYIKQIDGTTTNAIIKLEAKDGNLTISNGDYERKSDFIIVVSKWEVVKE